MTRQDYVKIADVLASHMEVSDHFHSETYAEIIEFVAKDLAHMLKADNPRFDREKFLTACGVK
jgi:hypothetical protein